MPQCLQVMRYIKLLLWQLTFDSGFYSLLLSEEVIFECLFTRLQYRQLSGRLQGFLVVCFVRVLLLELKILKLLSPELATNWSTLSVSSRLQTKCRPNLVKTGDKSRSFL